MQEDLFGHVPQQGEMFTPALTVSKPVQHTPETIRARMRQLIAEAREAKTMPWTPRMVHSHTVMFPYMAEWLPDAEGKQLMLEFEAEMERLRRAA